MMHIGVVILGTYFCITSLWWLVQTTARYYRCRQRSTDFKTSLTYPCCCRRISQPVDGIVKMCMGGILAVAELTSDKGYEGDSTFLSQTELGTLFLFLLLSGAMDLGVNWVKEKSLSQHLDFMALALFYAVLATVLQAHAYFTPQPQASLYSLSAYVAICSTIAAGVEALWREQVMCPVIRSYFLLIQGTWWLNVALLSAASVPAGSPSVDSVRNTMLVYCTIFVAHVAVNLFIVLCLWLLVGKMVEKMWCGCGGLETGGPSEDVFLENRVPFNYHVLSRFDSETE